MMVFEAAMLVCLGAIWPFSIAGTMRIGDARGKSVGMMLLAWLGYGCGVVHKLFNSFDWVIILYLLNFVMVAIDLCLYWHLSKRNRAA